MGSANSSESENKLSKRAVELDKRAVELDKRKMELDKREMKLDKKEQELEKRAGTKKLLQRNSQELETSNNCGCWYTQTAAQGEGEVTATCPNAVCAAVPHCSPQSICLGLLCCC